MPDMNEQSETQQEWLGITEHKKDCWKDCAEPCNTLKLACWQLSQAKELNTTYKDGFKDGYNKAFVEADKNLKAVIADFNKANEWHKADVPTSPINKVVLGYIKHYNSKLFCLVGWNGEWWYDASTCNDEVKLIAWKEIVLPKESEIKSDIFPEITLPKGSAEHIDEVIADAEKRLEEKNGEIK